MSRVGFGSCHVGLPGQNSWLAPDPSHGRVAPGSGFLFIIFGLGQVLFLGLGDNFYPHPTRRTVGSVFQAGRVGWQDVYHFNIFCA
jgi:hypothetical protein